MGKRAKTSLMLGFCCLAVALNARAGVFYSGVVDIRVGPVGQIVALDLDEDGVADFSFRGVTLQTCDEPPSTFATLYSMAASWSNRVIALGSSAAALSRCDEIGPDPGEDYEWSVIGRSLGVVSWSWTRFDGQMHWGGPLAEHGNDGYVGVRFQIGDDFHYGWMHVLVDTNSPGPGLLLLTIREYAYNTLPETPIKAGAVSDICVDSGPFITEIGFSNDPAGDQDVTVFLNDETLYISVRDVDIIGTSPYSKMQVLLVQGKSRAKKKRARRGATRVLCPLEPQADGSFTGSVSLAGFREGTVRVRVTGYDRQTGCRLSRDSEITIISP